MGNQVMTVTGPVDVADLGFTLMHEHIFLDLMRDAWIFTNLLNDPELAGIELDMLRRAGGATVVDLTSGGLREFDNPIMFDQATLKPLPPPLAVRRAAERSRLKIIMGAGWYHENYYKPRLWDLSTDQLTEEIIAELSDGMEGTDVKAGIIGEIGAQYNRLSAIEERVLRAAARAQIETGAGLTTHTTRGVGGLEQLDVLEQEGVDLERVVLAHSGGQPYPRYHAEIARRGACVSFDRMGDLPDMTDFHRDRVLRSIKRLIDNGHTDRIVLSHDVCYAEDLATNGGCGYAWLPLKGRALLEREIGLTDAQWNTIVVETPKRILAGT
ncbi:MAG: hypothetical protein OXF41_17435 [bacterium]|nr:hypothetical protein [bacterium]